MITLQTQVHVAGLTAKIAYEFLTTFEDADYQAWWPGVHLKVIAYRRYPNHVDNIRYLDQFIGDYRVKATEVVLAAIPNREFVRQTTILGVRVPVRMIFEFDDDDAGVTITHTVHAGFAGWGRVLDPAFRLFYFSRRFAAALDEHMKTELAMLADLTARES